MHYGMVRVRLGWRTGTGGQVPRIPRPAIVNGIMSALPGSYIGWQTVRADGDNRSQDSWQIMDEPDSVYATPMVMKAVRQGHLMVVDEDHEFYPLMPDRPDGALCPWESEPEVIPNKKRGRRTSAADKD